MLSGKGSAAEAAADTGAAATGTASTAGAGATVATRSVVAVAATGSRITAARFTLRSFCTTTLALAPLRRSSVMFRCSGMELKVMPLAASESQLRKRAPLAASSSSSSSTPALPETCRDMSVPGGLRKAMLASAESVPDSSFRVVSAATSGARGIRSRLLTLSAISAALPSALAVPCTRISPPCTTGSTASR